MPFGKEAILAVLLTALLCVTAASVDDNFTFCEPMNGFLANDSTVSFPSFPPQFSVQIEAVVGQVNFTFREAEYYDGVGQRGRRDVYFSNHHYTLISDFTTDQAFHILYTEGEVTDCSVVPLEYDMATNYTFHSIPGPNGTLRIGSANDVLRIAGRLKDQEVYLGQEFVRGVLTDHWQYCFASENLTYLLNYYFAVDGWRFPLNASRVPILAAVDGRSHKASGEFTIVQSTYTYTAFDPSPLGDDVFAVPEGVVCRNRKNLKPLPPLDIKYISSISESTNRTNGHSSYSLFYYDRQANLVRYDFNFRDQSDPKSIPRRVSVIHDFTQGVQYRINRDNGTCNVTSLNAGRHSFDEVVDDQGNYALASLLHILSPYNDSTSAYVYEGPTTVRGIAAEAWLAFIPVANTSYPNVTLKNVTNLMYFSRDGWVVNGQSSTMQILLRLRIRGTVILNDTIVRQFDFMSDILNVDVQEPPFEVFDAFVCFPPDQTKDVMFTLPVSPTANTLSLLRSNIRAALSKFTGTPGSQFGNIQIQTYSQDSIVVNLLLHDPPNAGYTNSTRKNSELLLNEITTGITSGTLKIQLSDGSMVSPQLLQQLCPAPIPMPSSTPAVFTASSSTPNPVSSPTSNPTSSPVSSSTPNLSPSPTSNPASSATSSSTPNSMSRPTSNSTSSATSSPISNSSSSPMSSSTPSLMPSPTSNPNSGPTSNPTSTQPSLVGVGVGCFIGGFITCLLVGLLVAGIALAIRTCMRKRKSYDTGYSRQMDEM